MDTAATRATTTRKLPREPRAVSDKGPANRRKAAKATRPTEKKNARRSKKSFSKEELFARNMEMFKRTNPHLVAVLEEIEGPHSTLVFDDDGDADIEFRGNRLYGTGAKRFADKQVADYWKSSPQRIQFIPPQSSTLDRTAGEFNYRMLRRAVDAGIEFAHAPTSIESFYLIIYGVGLGQHINKLVEDTNCKGLVLVEPNMEFMYHSLSVFDWADLFERFEGDDDKYIALMLGNDYKQFHHTIRNFVRSSCPSFFDGTVVFHHYKNSIMEMTEQEMRKDANLFLSGLGFLEDELLMVSNTHANLKDYDSHIYKRPTTARTLPAFVIGSGPSLDQCLDVIRDNADKAIVISCGTALRILLTNGITPDFHIEMENVELVYDILSEKAAQFDLSNVCLIASTTIDPRVNALFETKALFFRQVLASWEIFSLGADTGLHEVGPTVTNAGLSFAQEIGCREFYFFGIDYGTRHRDRHHAKDSEYRPGGKAAYTDEFNRQRQGNFGGMIHTHGVFGWARAVIEQCIRHFRVGRTYYNCSDGVSIDGAVPKVAKSLRLPAGADKAKEIADILGGFPRYSRELFEASWSRRDWAGEVEVLCDTLIGLCDIKDRNYRLRYLAAMARTLIPKNRPSSAEILMIRGSVLMVLISAAYYLNRITDRKKAPKLEKIIRTEVVHILQDMKKEAADGLRALQA